MPSARRSNVSFVLWADRPILVECGPTAPWQLLRLGIDHSEIAEVAKGLPGEWREIDRVEDVSLRELLPSAPR